MRQSRTAPYRNVRPGRALRPDASQPRSAAGQSEQGGEAHQPSLAVLSSENYHLRCLVFEYERALRRRGLTGLVEDLRVKYGFPTSPQRTPRAMRVGADAPHD